MEVPFTPEQESRLVRLARIAGTEPTKLVQEAALRLLEENGRFRAAVREGISQADRGDLVDEYTMDARFEQMLNS